MPRSANELRKLLKSNELRATELTKEEITTLYGKGNDAHVMYRKIERDGKSLIVSRSFQPDEKVPAGYADSPVKVGAPPSHPSRADRAEDEYDSVVAVVPEAK